MNNESKFQSDEDVGNDEIREPTHVLPNRLSYKIILKVACKIGRSWLLHYIPNDGPTTCFMKCTVCQKCVLNPYGRYTLIVKVYKIMLSRLLRRMSTINNSVACWEDVYFPQRANIHLVTQGLNVMVYREQSLIIIMMKNLYSTVWSDRSILTYQDIYQFFFVITNFKSACQ